MSTPAQRAAERIWNEQGRELYSQQDVDASAAIIASEYAEMERDAKRLDKLEVRGCTRIDCISHGSQKPDTWEIDCDGVEHSSLRAAIDSAPESQ